MPVEEKRTTRGARKKKDQESSQQIKDLTVNAAAQASHYLVPPNSKGLLTDVLSNEKLEKIKEKTVAKSKFLSKEKEAEMESLLNDVIYQQMKKLKAQSDFISQFHDIYEL